MFKCWDAFLFFGGHVVGVLAGTLAIGMFIEHISTIVPFLLCGGICAGTARALWREYYTPLYGNDDDDDLLYG